MSYRLIKLWNKDPKSAAKESSFNVVLFAFMVVLVLSGGFDFFPPIWQILIVVAIAGIWIWGNFRYAKTLIKQKEEEKRELSAKDTEQ